MRSGPRDRPHHALYCGRCLGHTARQLLGRRRAALWADLVQQGGAVCWRCGRVDHLVIDHIDPDAPAEVLNSVRNLQILCNRCNIRKGRRVLAWGPERGLSCAHQPHLPGCDPDRSGDPCPGS